MSIHSGVTHIIGSTPIVALERMTRDLDARIVIKLESRNPGGSVKDRIGASMIAKAEREGSIAPGSTVLIEPTSGNTGIALAMIGASKGYEVVLTMPESMSLERRRLLAAFGARLVLTPAPEGMQGAVNAARDEVDRLPGAFMPGQFTNPANPQAHYETTGPEIHVALGEARIGAFVAGVGTGGTVSGAGRYLRDVREGVRIVAVEPAESPIIAQRLRGEPITPGPHGIQGMGANFIPDTLDLDVLDEVVAVSTAESIEVARRLAAEEGLLCGISSGANVAAALRLATRPEMAGTTIVTVAPSTGERYLSTPLWEGLEQ